MGFLLLTQVMCEEEVSLRNHQEEADTKVFICTKHAVDCHNSSSACINTVETDISIYAIYFSQKIDVEIYVKTGVKERTRVLKISNVALELGKDVCQALPALHSFSGNDYTSSFHGIGKVKALNVLLNSPEFIATFKEIGENVTFDSALFESIERFVLKLYGLKGCTDVNEGRYVKFTSSKITPPPQKLPPTRDALLCHCKRVSFVTAMVKKSLETDFQMPSPDGYGWSITEGKLSIVWIILPPAPDEVLQLVSCNCKKSSCRRGNCNCLGYNLACTDLCGCGENCENQKKSQSDSASSSDEVSDLEEPYDDDK